MERGYYQPKIEMMYRKDLEDLQLERLKKAIHRFYMTKFGYKKLGEAGVKPSDIKSFEDFHKKIPMLTKAELKKADINDLIAPDSVSKRFLATSGTKGQPLPLRYTLNELSDWIELVARTLFTNTFDETDTVLFPVPISQFTGGFGMHEGLRKLNCGIIATGGMPTNIQVAILNGMYGVRPTAIVSIASYMFRVAEIAESQGIEPTSLGLKKASLGAEPWSEECRKKIEKKFGIKAYDSYGLGEVWGPGVAAECEYDRNSLHGWEDYFHFEVIDHETGDILGENEWGELVITPLCKEAMPILRFRTGDKTKINGFECECGRTHIKINRITDRFDDLIFIRGLKIYPNNVEEMLHSIRGVGSEYQIIKPMEDSSDPLKLVVEKDKNMNVEDLASIIGGEFKKRFNHRPIVEILDFGKMPRTPGKVKRILVASS